jgi:hypothetical protein
LKIRCFIEIVWCFPWCQLSQKMWKKWNKLSLLFKLSKFISGIMVIQLGIGLRTFAHPFFKIVHKKFSLIIKESPEDSKSSWNTVLYFVFIISCTLTSTNVNVWSKWEMHLQILNLVHFERKFFGFSLFNI